MRRVMVLLAGVAVVLVAVGGFGSVRAGDGLLRTTTVVDGVPLTLVRPATGDGPRPGAVVVHGFAGSARLMQPFADTLARNGYVVALPDLAGHGASTVPMTDPESDVDVAVRTLRDQSDVDPARIVLIGHSRGAAAVTAYAGTHRDIAATVALSLGAPPAVVPRNLLLLYGQLEFFAAEVARQTLAQARPDATVSIGQTYGSHTDGTAVRAEAVPGVEHVSILFSPAAHGRTLAWLDETVRPGTGGGRTHSLDRLWPAGLLLLGLLVGFGPLAGLALAGARRRIVVAPEPPPPTPLGPPPARADQWPLELVRLVLAVAAGLVAGAVVGVVAPEPALGLAVGGYTALVLAAFGLVAFLAAVAGSALGWWPVGGAPRRLGWWGYLGVALLAVYATAMVVVPIHIGLTWVRPSVPRLGPLIALLVAAWVLFGAAEWLGRRRWYLHAAVMAAALGLLLALAVVGLASGFLLLILPLLAGLIAIGAAVAAVLRRLAVPPWLTAAVAAPPLAWTVATTLPLT